MAKRRSVMLGLGALAFGSGAVTMSGAFSSDVTNPSAELQVLADARMVVRAPATIPSGDPSGFTGTTAAVKKDPLDSFADPAFDRASLPTAQIHQTDENDNYLMRAGVTTGEDAAFRGIMEIANNDGTSHDVGINYADYDSSTEGYGSDVDTASWGVSNTLDRQDVQEIYQFKVPNDASYLPSSAAAAEYLLSPDPTVDSDKYKETITIGNGESAILVLDFNTSGKTGTINNAATGGNPFQASTYVSLLDSLWVEVDPV